MVHLNYSSNMLVILYTLLSHYCLCDDRSDGSVERRAAFTESDETSSNSLQHDSVKQPNYIRFRGPTYEGKPTTLFLPVEDGESPNAADFTQQSSNLRKVLYPTYARHAFGDNENWKLYNNVDEYAPSLSGYYDTWMPPTSHYTGFLNRNIRQADNHPAGAVQRYMRKKASTR